jgi:hypothetical protein
MIYIEVTGMSEEKRSHGYMVRVTDTEHDMVERRLTEYRTSTQQLFQAYVEWLAVGNAPIGYPGGMRVAKVKSVTYDEPHS